MKINFIGTAGLVPGMGLTVTGKRGQLTMQIDNDYLMEVGDGALRNLNANKTVENFQIIDDIVLYDFMNQYCNEHFENQLPGFVVPYAEIQKSYKTFVNSQMESEKDWWKF